MYKQNKISSNCDQCVIIKLINVRTIRNHFYKYLTSVRTNHKTRILLRNLFIMISLRYTFTYFVTVSVAFSSNEPSTGTQSTSTKADLVTSEQFSYRSVRYLLRKKEILRAGNFTIEFY